MKIAVAIVIGSIIVSVGVYQGFTFEKRMAVKECIKFEKNFTKEKNAINRCYRKIYYPKYIK
jgi:hypothetical protein